MQHLSIDVPEELVQIAGSTEAAQRLLFLSAIQELLRRGLISLDTAQAWLGESSADWMQLADVGGGFDFWNESEEDIYTLEHGEPR